MSKKRTSAEFCDEERTTEVSAGTFQQINQAKRGKLASFSDTTLHDLPIEMLEYILVKAVAMEVVDMKMAESVWKEKADLVISRIQTVCSQWNNVLMTNTFRNRVHRILDGTAQQPIHLEILQQFPIQFNVYEVTTMRDEIFLLCGPIRKRNGLEYFINVCDRNSLAIEVKDVIPLPGIANPEYMTACTVFSCLYILDWQSECSSVLRVTKDEGHPYNASTWISDLQPSIMKLAVSANGSLAIVSKSTEQLLYVVNIYCANGFLQHRIMLLGDIPDIRRLEDVLYRPNGNLVLVYWVRDQNPLGVTQLREIDVSGSIIRQYQSSLTSDTEANFADIYGRIWIIDWRGNIEVVDSELNQLDFAGPQSRDVYLEFPLVVHFNAERKDILEVTYISREKTSVLTIFRFTVK